MYVQRSTRARRARLAVIGAVALGGAILPAVGLGATAALAGPPPLCTVTAGVVSCVYSSNGTFVVPTGATSLTVTADGASGAADNLATGGLGGEAKATLTGSGLAGQTLAVNVGTAGSITGGGGNGGGNGGTGLVAAGGGGGGSNVKLAASVLVAAGGGGGAAVINNGGNGGTSAATTGQAGAGLLVGGGAGSISVGGAAGLLNTFCTASAVAGASLQGGNGATTGSACFGGGGGGGGYNGGGGGGNNGGGGGGGGGSAFPASTQVIGSITVTPNTADANTNTGDGQVTISYPQIATVTTVTSASPNPSNAGASVTFTATVSPNDAGGTVDFQVGGVDITGCTAQAVSLVGVNYQATCTTSALPSGANSITAIYSGDTSYLTSTSVAYIQNILAATTTTLSSSRNPSFYGQSVTFTATVSPTDGGGTVTFTNTTTATTLCNTVALALVGTNWQATCTTASLPLGSNDISAVYSGDVGYSTSTGTLTQQVLKDRTNLSASIYFNAGQTFTVTATLTTLGGPVSGQPVTFSTGFHTLCTATTNTFGVARCVLTGSQTLLVEENSFTITARYPGSATLDPSFATAHISMFP